MVSVITFWPVGSEQHFIHRERPARPEALRVSRKLHGGRVAEGTDVDLCPAAQPCGLTCLWLQSC
jgi:hypothetical protein